MTRLGPIMGTLARAAAGDVEFAAKLLTLAEMSGDTEAVADVVEHAPAQLRTSARVTKRTDPETLLARIVAGDSPLDVLGQLDLPTLRRFADRTAVPLPRAAIKFLLNLGDDHVNAAMLANQLLDGGDRVDIIRGFFSRWEQLHDDYHRTLNNVVRKLDTVTAGQLLGDPVTPIELYAPLTRASLLLPDATDLWMLARRLLDHYDSDLPKFIEALDVWAIRTPWLPTMSDETLRVLAEQDDGRIPEELRSSVRFKTSRVDDAGTIEQLRLVLSDDRVALTQLVADPRRIAELPGRTMHPILAGNPNLTDEQRRQLVRHLDKTALRHLLTATTSGPVLAAVVERVAGMDDLPGPDPEFREQLTRALNRSPEVAAAAAEALAGICQRTPAAEQITALILGSRTCGIAAVRAIPWAVLCQAQLGSTAVDAITTLFDQMTDTEMTAFAAVVSDRPDDRFGDLLDLAAAIVS